MSKTDSRKFLLEKEKLFSNKSISRGRIEIGWLTRIDKNGLLIKPEGRYLVPKCWLPIDFQNSADFEKILIKQVRYETNLDIFSYPKENELATHLGRVSLENPKRTPKVNEEGIPLLEIYAPNFHINYRPLDEKVADKNLFLSEI